LFGVQIMGRLGGKGLRGNPGRVRVDRLSAPKGKLVSMVKMGRLFL